MSRSEDTAPGGRRGTWSQEPLDLPTGRTTREPPTQGRPTRAAPGATPAAAPRNTAASYAPQFDRYVAQPSNDAHRDPRSQQSYQQDPYAQQGAPYAEPVPSRFDTLASQADYGQQGGYNDGRQAQNDGRHAPAGGHQQDPAWGQHGYADQAQWGQQGDPAYADPYQQGYQGDVYIDPRTGRPAAYHPGSGQGDNFADPLLADSGYRQDDDGMAADDEPRRGSRRGLIVAGALAAALAALLEGGIEVRGKTVAIIASGGNVDVETFKRALDAR